MSEQLHFNILSFNWPEPKPVFHFTIKETENSHPIYKTKWSEKIYNAFPELRETDVTDIYTTFTEPTKNSTTIEIEMYDEELKIYNQFLKHQIRTYFQNKGFVVTRNFVRDIQIWIPDKTSVHPLYTLYSKYTLKLQYAVVSDYPELMVSFDGKAKILNASISDLEDTTIITKFIYNSSVYDYRKMHLEDWQDFYNELDVSKAYPLLNSDIAKVFEIPPSPRDDTNRYIKFIKQLADLKRNHLDKEDFKSILSIVGNFIKVPTHRIERIDYKNGLLEYSNKQTAYVPKMELGKLKPYRKPLKQNIKFIFIYHNDHKEAIKTFTKYIKEGTGFDEKYNKNTYFYSLKQYINIVPTLAGNLFIEYKDKDNPVQEIKEHLERLPFEHDTTQYAAFYISPHDRFVQEIEKRMIYVRLKELLLKEEIVMQAIDFEKMQNDINSPYRYQFHLNNIALALHAKLGGVPWKLALTDKKELVIGVGAFTFQDENTRYIASAFSFQNNGLFRGFEYFSENDTGSLAGSICKKIKEFTSLQKPDKVVIHFFKDMSKKEIEPIKRGMAQLDLKVPLYILNINKTDSQDLVAFDKNWKELMPKSGTYIRIGSNRFLLFNNARYNNDAAYPRMEGYPFPIKIKISSPDEDAFEDTSIILELLTQVYQFSRLYWKSLRQQNVPITIKYPAMVAQLAPRFKAPIPEHAKDKLWFL